MISQPTNRVSRLSETTSRYMPKANKSDKGKEARVHRLDRHHGMLMTVGIRDGSAVRRQAGPVVIALGLAQSYGSRRCR